MPKTRQNKVSRLLQKELGDIFQRQGKVIFNNRMITVTSVRISADLGQARILLSVFPSVDKDEFENKLKDHAVHLRHELAGRIRHQLKSVPELHFFLDDSLDYLDNIDKLLNE